MKFTYKLQNIYEAADWLWQRGKNQRLWLLNGDMGAGKTTLVAALATHLGIVDAVSSPTYSIINRYQLPLGGSVSTLYHIDLYRLKDEAEAIDAGLEECVLEAAALTIIEWARKAPMLLDLPHLYISIHESDENERILTLNKIY